MFWFASFDQQQGVDSESSSYVVYNCLVYIRVHIRLDKPHPRGYTAPYLYSVHNQSDNHHRTSCVYIL